MSRHEQPLWQYGQGGNVSPLLSAICLLWQTLA